MEPSAFIYIGLTIIVVVLAYFAAERVPVMGRTCTRQQARGAVAETAIYLLLAGVSACRVAIGHDYWNYRDNFNLIAQERHVSSEWGFNLLVKAMVNLFGYDNYKPIFFVFSVVTVYFFVKALHDQADRDYALALFLLMTNGYYFQSMNSVRYYLALAVALFSMKYVLHGEYGKFLLWILAASAFHKSVLLVIPVYLAAHLLAKARLKKWHYAAGAVLALSLIFGQSFYREIIFRIYPYYRDSAFDNGSISYVNIAKCLGALALCVLCYHRALSCNDASQDADVPQIRRLRFYAFLNLAALVVYCCGSFIPEVSRVGYYMTASQIFLIPALLRAIPETWWSGWFRKLCYVGTIATFSGYFLLLIQKMYTDDVALLPYLNWIFN